MADDEDIAALVVDNGSGMCKGKILRTCSVVGVLLSSQEHSRSGNTICRREKTPIPRIIELRSKWTSAGTTSLPRFVTVHCQPWFGIERRRFGVDRRH